MKNPITQLRKLIHSIGNKRSPEWPSYRRAWLANHPSCAACGSAKDLEVHHKRPFHLFPALELDMKNYITLCESIGSEHHLHTGHLGNFKVYNENVVEDAAAMLKRIKGE